MFFKDYNRKILYFFGKKNFRKLGKYFIIYENQTIFFSG